MKHMIAVITALGIAGVVVAGGVITSGTFEFKKGDATATGGAYIKAPEKNGVGKVKTVMFNVNGVAMTNLLVKFEAVDLGVPATLYVSGTNTAAIGLSKRVELDSSNQLATARVRVTMLRNETNNVANVKWAVISE